MFVNPYSVNVVFPEKKRLLGTSFSKLEHDDTKRFTGSGSCNENQAPLVLPTVWDTT